MKTITQWIVLVALTLMVFITTGCGGSSEAEPETPTCNDETHDHDSEDSEDSLDEDSSSDDSRSDGSSD